MIDSLTATNIDTGDDVTLNDLTYPLHTFTWDYAVKGEAEQKMRKAGRHKVLKQIDTMTIQMEGNMMADPNENYWDIRQTLMNVLLPHPDALELNHVRFDMVLSGAIVTYFAECTLADLSVPLEALSPTRSEFMFHWECPEGYWKDAATDAVVFI